jgi:hypothetical protein
MPTTQQMTSMPTHAPTKTTTSMPTAQKVTLAPTSDQSVSPTALYRSVNPTMAPTEPVVPACMDIDDCPQQFCGSDGKCYDYTCENFFRYSPTLEYDDETASDLTCRDAVTELHVINFGCIRATGNQVPPSSGVGMKPNRLCTGNSAENTILISFECFQFDDSTDFDPFVSEAEGSSFDCDQQEGLPAYFYSAGYTIAEYQDGDYKSKTTIANGPVPTFEFVPESALKSLFAVIVKEDVTPRPTTVYTHSPTAAPTEPQSAAFVTGASMAFAFTSGLIILFI